MKYRKKNNVFTLTAVLAIAVGMSLASGEARADDPRREAARLFERGVQALDRCMYGDAIDSFKEAYRLSPHRVNHYYLGLAHQRSGATSDALHFFRKYLYEAEQEGDDAHDAQVVEVRRLIEELEKKVLAEERRQRERTHRESMHASVTRLLDTLIDTHGGAVAAPYLHAYAQVASRAINNPRDASRTVSELDYLQEKLRAELSRSPVQSSPRLRATGAVLTTAGLLTAGVGLGYGIASRGGDGEDHDATLRAMAYGGVGLLATVLGWSIYKYGKAKQKPPLLGHDLSLLPGTISGGGGIVAAGNF